MSRRDNNLKRRKAAKRKRLLERTGVKTNVSCNHMVRIDAYPNGRKYLSQLSLPSAMTVSDGIAATYLLGVRTDAQEVILWDMLWMFKSKDVIGFKENGISVYGVVIDGKRVPFAVGQDRAGHPHITMVSESSSLNLSEADCEKRLSRINDDIDDPMEWMRLMSAAMSACGANVTVSTMP